MNFYRSSITTICAFLHLALLLRENASSFVTPGASHTRRAHQLLATKNGDDDVSSQLKRAKELIAKTKAKMEAKEKESEGGGKSKLPFFASKKKAAESGDKKDKVVKAVNDEGLITTDGALMAQLSEAEEWEVRSLLDVFENEIKDQKDPLADRDVAASILGLRKVLQTEDYKQIFDQRNRFIGEQ
mmetsp:Transcript_60576/g.174789  ORF Transcript_60576/g.174789 Transcript_60576/m.174789 type:complete len:186 (-) Transcript_60576:89-646(-)